MSIPNNYDNKFTVMKQKTQKVKILNLKKNKEDSYRCNTVFKIIEKIKILKKQITGFLYIERGVTIW